MQNRLIILFACNNARKQIGLLGLAVHDHDKCVVKCNIFNKSKRKAYVNKVQAFDHNNNPIDITWSNHIDKLGNGREPVGIYF